MPTTPLASAHGVSIYGGEDGFELHLSTTDGEYVVNVHACSEQLLEEVEREIGEYWQEARAEMGRAKILCKRVDDDAYDMTDPKHPGWSILADWEPAS